MVCWSQSLCLCTARFGHFLVHAQPSWIGNRTEQILVHGLHKMDRDWDVSCYHDLIPDFPYHILMTINTQFQSETDPVFWLSHNFVTLSSYEQNSMRVPLQVILRRRRLCCCVHAVWNHSMDNSLHFRWSTADCIHSPSQHPMSPTPVVLLIIHQYKQSTAALVQSHHCHLVCLLSLLGWIASCWWWY